MAIHDGNAHNFSDLIAMPDKLVLVDFWADWCAPCKQLAPILDELAAEFSGRLEVVKVDTNAQPELAANQGIMSLPTLQFYLAGELVKSEKGGRTKRQLLKTIESLLCL